MSQDSDETTGLLVPEPTQLPGTSLPCLRVLAGERQGQLLPLTLTRTLIGRASHCDLVLRAAGMSREHAEILRLDRHELWLRDLKSTNGVTLNGEAVTYSRLQAQDEIGVMGQPLLRVHFHKAWELQLASRMQERISADPLTGAFSGQHLRLRLEEDLAIARRKSLKLCLLALRPVNIDTQLTSDSDRSLLMAIAERLEGLLPTEDLLARWKDLDFLALLRGKTRSQAHKLAQRLIDNFHSQPFSANVERPASRTIQLQWALSEWHPEMQPDDFLRQALEALA